MAIPILGHRRSPPLASANPEARPRPDPRHRFAPHYRSRPPHDSRPSCGRRRPNPPRTGHSDFASPRLSGLAHPGARDRRGLGPVSPRPSSRGWGARAIREIVRLGEIDLVHSSSTRAGYFTRIVLQELRRCCDPRVIRNASSHVPSIRDRLASRWTDEVIVTDGETSSIHFRLRLVPRIVSTWSRGPQTEPSRAALIIPEVQAATFLKPNDAISRLSQVGRREMRISARRKGRIDRN